MVGVRAADLLHVLFRSLLTCSFVGLLACAEEPATVFPPDASRPADAATDAAKPDAGPTTQPGTGSNAQVRLDGGSTTDAGLRDATAPTAPSRPRFPPFEANGRPIVAPAEAWTYLDFPDTQCRDGSAAGIAVSLNPRSSKLMIYLEGGGACFDALTCSVNPANTRLMREARSEGVFDRDNPDNPVRDWNFVYVPYCTGDSHGGARTNGVVEGVSGRQQFVGYLNMQRFLHRIVPTFPGVSDVLLTGVSAGGFGAAQNAVLVQRAFPEVKVKFVDDSGPPLARAVVPTCLQKKWRTLWNYDETFLNDCGDACPNEDDFTQDYGVFLARTFADRPAGLISADRDSVIAGFFGAGLDGCTGVALLTPVPATDFRRELLAYREKVRPFGQFSTFFPISVGHTFLGDDGLYSTQVAGVRLIDWFKDIVTGKSPGHVGP